MSRKWMKEGVSGLQGEFGEKVERGEYHCWPVSKIIRWHQYNTAISVAQCWFCHRVPNFLFFFLSSPETAANNSFFKLHQKEATTSCMTASSVEGLEPLWYFGSYQLHFQKTFLSTVWASRGWLSAAHFPPLTFSTVGLLYLTALSLSEATALGKRAGQQMYDQAGRGAMAQKSMFL